MSVASAITHHSPSMTDKMCSMGYISPVVK